MQSFFVLKKGNYNLKMSKNCGKIKKNLHKKCAKTIVKKYNKKQLKKHLKNVLKNAQKCNKNDL
jgi:hypothetical protein